jgi:uncharacterized SAM-binding protein YcdF (DUF218 family)
MLVANVKIWVRRFIFTISFLFLIWSLFWAAARFLIIDTGVTRADAIVVLSGSANYVERTRWAAALFRSGEVSNILITNDNLHGGWSSVEQRNPFFYEREQDELRASGVPEDKIKVIIEPVYSTFDEARGVRRFLEGADFRSVIVVTSPYHSRRALWSFRQAFAGSDLAVDINPVKADTGLQPSNWWASRRGWQEIPPEYVKLIYYWIRYRS